MREELEKAKDEIVCLWGAYDARCDLYDEAALEIQQLKDELRARLPPRRP